MSWLSLPLFPFVVVYLVKCRPQRAARRQAIRAMRALPPPDRRAVARSVRQGRPVDDARNAPAALRLAGVSSAKCRAEAVLAIAMLTVEAVRALVSLAEVHVRAFALQLLWLDAVALAIAYLSQFRRRARASERANLALHQQPHT